MGKGEEGKAKGENGKGKGRCRTKNVHKMSNIKTVANQALFVASTIRIHGKKGKTFWHY